VYVYFLRQGKRHWLHHVVFGKPKRGFVVDHKSGNSLDNRKENLRFATFSQNCANRPSRSKCGFKGVSFDSLTETWMAYVRVGGRRIKRTGYTTAARAAAAYNELARENHGEFAWLNGVPRSRRAYMPSSVQGSYKPRGSAAIQFEIVRNRSGIFQLVLPAAFGKGEKFNLKTASEKKALSLAGVALHTFLRAAGYTL
jgi:hypothetical protein